MNKDLLEIFKNVNDWLKFAEAKNAMIIAFNGASIYGIVKLPFLNFNCITPPESYFAGVIIVLIISSVIALFSFVPDLNFLKPKNIRKAEEFNFLFFGHLKDCTDPQIKKYFLERTGNVTLSKLDDDLIGQIRYNALIASRKYEHFRVSVWLTISAYVSIPIAIIFALYHYRNLF